MFTVLDHHYFLSGAAFLDAAFLAGLAAAAAFFSAFTGGAFFAFFAFFGGGAAGRGVFRSLPTTLSRPPRTARGRFAVAVFVAGTASVALATGACMLGVGAVL